jgi:hypothetical protein
VERQADDEADDLLVADQPSEEAASAASSPPGSCIANGLAMIRAASQIAMPIRLRP